jgi:hypothetical protein
MPIAMNLSYVSSYALDETLTYKILDACDYTCLVPTHLVIFLKHLGKGVKETCRGNLLLVPWYFSTCITPNPLGLRFCITHVHLTKKLGIQ